MNKEYVSLMKLLNLVTVLFLWGWLSLSPQFFEDFTRDVGTLSAVLIYLASLRWTGSDLDKIVRVT